MINGKAIKFGDNIDTDQIIGAAFLSLPTIKDMEAYAFKNYGNFRSNFIKGDIVVGGHNFGCGSSREQAPAVLKSIGVGAIVAKDFARIFYRNAVNIGIIVLECEAVDKISELDELSVDILNGRIINKTKGEEYRTNILPPFIKEIMDSSGIIGYMKKKNGR